MYDLVERNMTLHGSHLHSLSDVYLNMVLGACRVVQHLKVQLSHSLSTSLSLLLLLSST